MVSRFQVLFLFAAIGCCWAAPISPSSSSMSDVLLPTDRSHEGNQLTQTPPHEFPEESAITIEQALLEGQEEFVRAVLMMDTSEQDVDVVIKVLSESSARSCQELRLSGHHSNGFYLVRGGAGGVQQSQLIFCNFSTLYHQQPELDGSSDLARLTTTSPGSAERSSESVTAA